MAELQSGKKRRDYIDCMKGLGIVLVVLGHFMEQYRIDYKPIGAAFICIYMFHMALFCICSGLVAHFSLRKLVTQQVWLYAVGQALMLAFRAVILRENFAESGGLLQAFLLPWRHMWYLYALIFWHLTLPLLLRLRDCYGWRGALAGMAVAVVIGLWGGTVAWPFTLVRVFAYYPFYAFGVLFRRQIDRLDEYAAKNTGRRIVPGAVLLVAGAAFCFYLMHRDGPLDVSAKIFNDVAYGDGYTAVDRAWFYFVGIAVSLALIAALGNCHGMAKLGQRTLPVYLLHLPILAFYNEVTMYFQPVYGRPAAVVAVFVLLQVLGVVCMLASDPVSKTFNAVANVWYKRLNK